MSNKNEKSDVSLVFFPDDQARIRVVEEFVESVNKNQRHRNLGSWLETQPKIGKETTGSKQVIQFHCFCIEFFDSNQ